MIHTHKLSIHYHFDFLNQERKDPITGDLIKENDEIVICSSCKSAFLKESWEYLRNTHCEQKKTLATIPTDKNLVFKISNQNYFKLKEIPSVAFTMLVLCFSFISILALLIFQEGSSKYWLSGIIVLSSIFYLLFAIFPLHKIQIEESGLILTRGFNRKSFIPYEDIREIIFLIEKSTAFNNHAYVYIRLNNMSSISEELNLKNIKFTNNGNFIQFIRQLSKKIKVTLKIDSSYQADSSLTNIPVEWI